MLKSDVIGICWSPEMVYNAYMEALGNNHAPYESLHEDIKGAWMAACQNLFSQAHAQYEFLANEIYELRKFNAKDNTNPIS